MILNGFIDGFLRWTANEVAVGLPLPKILTAEFVYEGTLDMATSLSNQGVRSVSASTLGEESGMINCSAEDLEWVLFQVSTGYLDEAAEGNVPVVEYITLSTVGGGGDSTLVTRYPVVADTDVVVADYLGSQYTNTVVTTTNSTVTLTGAGDKTGTRVAVSYFRALGSPAERRIRLGASTRLPRFGLYGRFYGNGETLLVFANNAVVKPSANLAGGSVSTISPGFQLLRDNNDVLATVIRLPEGA